MNTNSFDLNIQNYTIKELEDLLTWLAAGGLVILLFGLIFWWLTILMDK